MNGGRIVPQSGKRVWRGADIAKRPDWISVLPSQAVADLESAVAEERACGRDSLSIDIDRYDFASLASVASELRAALADGYGFCLLRGLPADHHSVDELKMMLLVLGRHIGLIGPQEDRPRSIGEVMDTGPKMPKDFYFHRGGALPMHMDPIDVVGLLCVRKAKQGGESGIASSMAVHNEILSERPDLLDLLYRGFHHIRRHDPATRSRKALTDYLAPVFADIGGETICSFLPESILGGEKAGLIVLSDAERESIAYMQSVAERPGIMLSMDLQPGDIQFLNNRSILHNRLDYEDYPEPERRRLLLRLWLTIPGWRKYPPNIPHTDVELGRIPA